MLLKNITIQNPGRTLNKTEAYVVSAKFEENELLSASELPGKPCHPYLINPFSKKCQYISSFVFLLFHKDI